MEYLDFELSVDARESGEYQVRARAPSGEVRDRTRFPFQGDELASQLLAVQQALRATRGARDGEITEGRDQAAAQRAALEGFGVKLFNALLTGRVLVAWRASLSVAAREQRGLRLQLRMQSPEMAALPWELMYDPEDAAFVCLNPGTPVVRYPEMERAAELLTVKLPLRILGMVASPRDLPRLNKEAERTRIEHALAGLRRSGMVDLQWIEGSTYRDLQQAMRGGPWHVFHFIGHGGFEPGAGPGRGVLALEATPTMDIPVDGQSGTQVGSAPAHFVPADTLGQVLRGHLSLRLVVLNSCLGARSDSGDLFSSTALTLIRRGIPAVIAMQNEITDRAAIVFAQAFYASLAALIPVDRAVTDARTALSAASRESHEWGTPVLMMRSPNGTLFTPPAVIAPSTTDHDRTAGHRLTRLFRVATRPAVLGALVGVPVAAAALLGWTRAPSTELTMYAQVSRFAVALASRHALDGRVPVTSLGISGLKSVELPVEGSSRVISTDFLQLTALEQGGTQGRLTLDLSDGLPAGTLVALAAGDSPGTYLLELGDSVLDLTIGVVGPVRVTTKEQVGARRNFRTPGVIRISPERGTLGIEFQPTPAERRLFTQQLPAHGLDLIKVDRFESAAGTDLDETSTVLGGHIAIGRAEPRDLAPAEEIRAAGVRGELTSVWLDGNHLELVLRGSAERLSSGPPDARKDLTPSLLDWLTAYHPAWLALAAASYVGVAVLLLAARLKGRN